MTFDNAMSYFFGQKQKNYTIINFVANLFIHAYVYIYNYIDIHVYINFILKYVNIKIKYVKLVQNVNK